MISPILDFLVALYDPHADLHAANVTDYATMLATSTGLSKQDILHIQIAAKYHDIGKIAIPEDIRRRVGPYTPIERHAMQQHSQIGAQILQILEFDSPIVQIVLGHHENFDGSGYPSALRRDRIPIGARHLRITDTFDALTHDRGYRRACSQKRALTIMDASKEHYDPDLLAAFHQIIESQWGAPPSPSLFTPRA